jgi:hypothetical protein
MDHFPAGRRASAPRARPARLPSGHRPGRAHRRRARSRRPPRNTDLVHYPAQVYRGQYGRAPVDDGSSSRHDRGRRQPRCVLHVTPPFSPSLPPSALPFGTPRQTALVHYDAPRYRPHADVPLPTPHAGVPKPGMSAGGATSVVLSTQRRPLTLVAHRAHRPPRRSKICASTSASRLGARPGRPLAGATAGGCYRHVSRPAGSPAATRSRRPRRTRMAGSTLRHTRWPGPRRAPRHRDRAPARLRRSHSSC